MSAVLWPNGSTTRPRVSSPYGWRTHPVTGVRDTFHYGIDLGHDWDVIKAPVTGTVTFAGYNGGAGNEVRIREDGTGHVFRLFHNKALWVSTGQRVSQGQDVAVMGTTGMSTGVHCHFQIEVGGSTVEPTQYVNNRNASAAGGGGSAVPTPQEDEMQFDNQNRIYWPNGFFNSYDQGVFNALKYWHDNGKELAGTEGTVEREVWAANNWMLNTSVQATAAASAKATVEALKASGIPVAVELDDDDIAALSADVARSVLAGIPKPAESFEVTVKPTAS